MRLQVPVDLHLPSELHLTRSLLLEGRAGAQTNYGLPLRNARNYNCVTYWEELLCVAIHTKLECLMAVVSIHQEEGYSSLLNNQDSTEFVGFFVDWGRGEGYQPSGLVSFAVGDTPQNDQVNKRPYHQLVTTRFDADCYWEGVLDGFQPKVRAVLSWNQEPTGHVEFQPVFGNVVESRIRTESIKDVMALYE